MPIKWQFELWATFRCPLEWKAHGAPLLCSAWSHLPIRSKVTASYFSLAALFWLDFRTRTVKPDTDVSMCPYGFRAMLTLLSPSVADNGWCSSVGARGGECIASFSADALDILIYWSLNGRHYFYSYAVVYADRSNSHFLQTALP